ncbi:MAG TPA: hypothetical protein VML75_03540 [Kofleriaceae bacterium]|nr:hypothetical protein [Kofleriaceae bacterium]
MSAGELSSIALNAEVLVDGRVASSGIATFDCGGSCGARRWDQIAVDFCAFDSGELRYGSTSCRGPTGSCTADGFCLGGGCTFCQPGEKCGLARVPWSPSHGWLECVPAGAQADGEVCSISEEGFDDCAVDLHCYQGMCRIACDDECSSDSCFDTAACPGRYCTQIPLTSPRVGVCL